MTISVDGLRPEVLQELRALLGPSFASPEQEAFFDSRRREILYSGWMGAGKSRILCEKAWYLADRYPGATFGIFRKVAASLPATTLRTWRRDVMGPRMHRIASQNLSESWYELDNGSRIYFLGLDPDPITGVPSKIGSLDLAWAGVDEAVEVSEADWMMLLGRLRDPRIPFHQIAAATNPAHPKHWLLLRFLAGDPAREMFRAQSNRFLPADYLDILGSLGDSAHARRLGKGEWAAAEGVIWRVLDWQITPPDAPSARTIAGLDWGFVHPIAAVVVGRSGTGRLAVRDEYVASGQTVDQAAPGLAAMAERNDVEAFYCDPSEPGLLAQLKAEFKEHKRWHQDCRLRATITEATNDVLPGLQAVDKAIRDGMTFDPKCVSLLAEIPGYTWKPQKGGGFQEVPIDINDDACDALRYAVMAFEPNKANPWASLSAGKVGGTA